MSDGRVGVALEGSERLLEAGLERTLAPPGNILVLERTAPRQEGLE